MKYHRRTPQFVIISLAITYLVGLVGFLFAPHVFEKLTPVNLLYSTLLVFLFHKRWDKTFLFFALAIALSGFLVEWAGVASGMIFGEYSYGPGLGPKLFDIPLLIALNWLLLIYCTAGLAGTVKVPWWLQAVIAATLMVAIDVLIEPFAIRYGLWSWQSDIIPLQNYIAWFGVSLALLLPFHYYRLPEHNVVAMALYIIQLLFFGLLFLLV